MPHLNVILHGAFIYQQDKNDITAWIPKLDPEHVYRAGNWLGETQLQRGNYELQGVQTGGTGEFDPKRNLILKPLRRKPDEEKIHAKLVFPRPKTISSLRVAEIPRAFLDKSDELAGALDPQPVGCVHVFTYDFEDESKLKLVDTELKPTGGHYWEPVFTADHVNLHIFAAEDHYEQPSLAVEDFNRCARIFGYQLTLRQSIPMSGVRDAAPPTGVQAEETEDLAPRTLRMALLGRLVTQEGDANQVWYADAALDGNPHACCPYVIAGRE